MYFCVVVGVIAVQQIVYQMHFSCNRMETSLISFLISVQLRYVLLLYWSVYYLEIYG